MRRSQTGDEVGDARRQYVSNENAGYEYNVSYAGYAGTTNSGMTTTNINQPLPGQPPLPPMPPPSTAVPPPPHVYPHGIPPHWPAPQMYPHGIPPHWQWMMHQTAAQTAVPLPPQSGSAPTFQREIQPVRGNTSRRERLNQGWNNTYNVQRSNNFHRKNRRMTRPDQTQNQFDMDGLYTMAAATNPNILNNIAMLLNNQRNRSNQPTNSATRTEEPSTEPDEKEDVNVKRLKHRRPMSLSYPSRPWNREHAEKALSVEMEYNKKIKGQSLIIKFPDPDLNKDIVRDFHPGIQNIHFQSPSGPRYCFIQMAQDVNIDEAIKELEKIPFGVGYLKVERKSLRDEDNPMPEEIDPYTLYIGNLPESVNVNEVKSKFPTAVRIDVGYAQKMRNTRYGFIRFNSVDESIAAYKKAHDLMWDTRSIIVRFRRQRGNTCLPGETKANSKKSVESSNSAPALSASETKVESRETSASGNNLKLETVSESAKTCEAQQENSVTSTDMAKTITNKDSSNKATPQEPQSSEKPSTAVAPFQSESTIEDVEMLMEIKEEPIEYDEVEDNDDDDDDEDDNEDENVDGKWQILIPKIGPIKYIVSERRISTSDHLDNMFTDLEHAMDDIDW